MWARFFSPWWLALASPLVVVGALRRPAAGRWGAIGTVALLLAIVAGFVGHYRLDRLGSQWASIWEAQEARISEHLNRELSGLVERGERAVQLLADSALVARERPEQLRRLRAVSGVTALALYDADGILVAWDGIHQGPVPEAVRTGARGYVYGEGPLFGYLYVAERLPANGGTAAAALLLRADLPPDLGALPGDFASNFRDRVGVEILVSRAERAAGEAIWDLRLGDEVLLSVALVQPGEAERRGEERLLWLRLGVLLIALGWLFLAAGSRRTPEGPRSAGLLLLAAALLLPLGPLLGAQALFSPGEFLLPGPGEVTLGRLLAVALAAVAAAGLLPAGLRRGRGWPGAGLVVVVGFPLLLVVLRAAPAADLLAGPDSGWVAYQAVLALLLTLMAVLALELGRRPGPGNPILLGGAMGGALLAGAALGILSRQVVILPVWPAVLWAVPALMAVRGLGEGGARHPILVWGVAAILGTTAALPFAWSDRVHARMAVAEARMERVGMGVDPYLEFLLLRLGERVEELHLGGTGPLELLLNAWAGSGVAREGYPVRLTLWSPGGVPQEELRVGVQDPRPGISDDFLAEARTEGVIRVRRFEMADARYLATVPLPDGSVVTATVPPLRGLAAPEPLGPLFAPGATDGDPLTLIPLLPEEAEGFPETLTWSPVAEGWRGEMVLQYPDGLYRANYLLDFPRGSVALSRAGLLILLNLAVLAAVWGAGRSLIAHRRRPRRAWTASLASFQARVTLVLFLFVLLPSLAFGTLAYQTLSGAAQRTAEALARRAVDDAAAAFLEVQGEMDLLSRRVRADLFLYQDGALTGGSPRELVEMGLYEGWLPTAVQRLLEGREEVVATAAASLGRWEYVVAYRRVPGGGVLASAAPLEAGAAALRSREVADLLGFAILLGAGFSLALALLVGRTLARPIQILQVASERVGGGNLGVRLPADRNDEFGAVFRAFNRMVQRLRRARRDLVRTTRRTQAIVEEAATGVIALDARGEVALANPRAERLLGVDLVPGERLPAGEGVSGEFARWVELYYRDGLREAGMELLAGDRRLRVRARRIARSGSRGGAVFSLEDVTDELRAERVLAWGEMAQQVAHEVKNPLTPIKLAVQHIRRAHEDRRPDFQEILHRNVEAVLGEIDRLARIARSFSRFAAPQMAGEGPLEPVPPHGVVEELLALYASGEGPVQFRGAVPEDLPPVWARSSELKEVLVNLLENARVATGEGGRVFIEGEVNGAGVELRVRDDGTGIPRELLPRIFEPHFSTRSTGSGLGLAIVRRLVESWGGTVTAESRQGEGTVIRMALLRWEEGAEAPMGNGEPEVGGGGDPEVQSS